MRLPDGIRRLFRLGDVRPDPRRDLDDELRHHFAESVREHVRHGATEAEARRMARERFGDEAAYRLALETIDEREVMMRERGEALDVVLRTVLSAVRAIRRTPGLTSAIVLILALGIGANAVMFGVVDRLLLSPPQHVVDADDVRHLHIRRTIFNGDVSTGRSITYPDYQDFAGVGAFEAVGGYTEAAERTVGRGAAARQLRAAAASASLFPLLGVNPVAGRFFVPEDDQVGAEPTVILSSEYWLREFGGDPSTLGAALDIGRGRYTVIGIAPPGFTGAELAPVDVWLPLTVSQEIEMGHADWLDSRGWYWLRAVVRLAPGSTAEAAHDEATAAHRGGRAELIQEDRYDADVEVLVAPIIAARGPSPTSEAQVAGWLAGVSLIVLLIACFNVMNLLLARSIQARREIAVRLALGVGRRRLIAEQVTESTLLALLGAGAALLLGEVASGPIHQSLLPNVAFADAGVSMRLASFTVVATLGAGLLTGLLPALQASRTPLSEALRAGGRGIAAGRSRTRTLLLIGQAGLSVVLLVGAGLFVQSLRRAQALDLGFDADRVVVTMLEWNETLESETRQAIYEDVLTRVRTLPDVRAAGLTYTIPFWSSISLGQPRVPGMDSIPRHHSGGPYVNKVGSGYFETMGLTIVEGRAFNATDDGPGAPRVAILTQSMARAIWPDGGSVGACLIIGDEDDPPCTEVVGIVENHRRQALVEDDPHFLYYVNQPHPAFLGPPQALMVGTRGDPAAAMDLLRDEVRAESSQIRFVNTNAMSDFVAPELRSWRLGAAMFTVFGLLALVVAAWGLYSVLAFDVAVRNHELGVRAALGADVSRLVRLVVRQALTPIGFGTALGFLVAMGASGFVEPLLFDVSARDPATYMAVAIALLSVALLAGAFPAWKATRADPREALRAD